MNKTFKPSVRTPAPIVCLVVGLAAALGSDAARAEPFETSGWSIDAKALLAEQAPEDVKDLARTLRYTKPMVCSVEYQLPIADIQQMLMIRVPDGYETTWFLYRTREEAVVVQLLSAAPNKVFSTRYRIVRPVEWDRVFAKFAAHEQRRPTPPSDERLQHGWFWPRGYQGVVSVYDRQRTREYLLATEDVHSLHVKGPIDKFFCETLFSGLHCRSGATVGPGWVMKDLEGLLHSPPLDNPRPAGTPWPLLVQFAEKPVIEPACRAVE